MTFDVYINISVVSKELSLLLKNFCRFRSYSRSCRNRSECLQLRKPSCCFCCCCRIFCWSCWLFNCVILGHTSVLSLSFFEHALIPKIRPVITTAITRFFATLIKFLLLIQLCGLVIHCSYWETSEVCSAHHPW